MNRTPRHTEKGRTSGGLDVQSRTTLPKRDRTRRANRIVRWAWGPGICGWLGASCFLSVAATGSAGEVNADRIRPHERNPRYWQYKGKPVLLLGGSKDDNLFQLPDLREHLDELVGVGGNFVRNTMSDRRDKGFEVYPFKRLANGRYDLGQWNDEYWKRFAGFLHWTNERGVFVQIEVWDRFDYSQAHWAKHPYRPANNVNYTVESSGLREKYPAPAWRDRQPFFHTVPGLPRYDRRLDVVRRYQERFVAKLLAHSLDYGHVLYCMDNETSTPPAWGHHWIEFITRHAREKGLSVFCTDMFNDGYEPERSKAFAQAFDAPEVYRFLDLSQINSRIFNETHWTRLRWVMDRTKEHPRPINHVKIYGSGNTRWGSGTPEDGVERFWRNLFAGCAAVRFHRDGAGNGLGPIAKASIRAARKLETLIKLWDVAPHQPLLSDRAADEAYLIARPGEAYAVYFTGGGSVGLDLTRAPGDFRLRWIDISTGNWANQASINGGGILTIDSPGDGPTCAVLLR